MVLNQAYLFLVFIANGIIIGLLFDFFRIARRVSNTNDMMTYLEDILFWILTGSLVLYSIFVFNNGEVRLFMFLGILLGAVSYMVIFSSHIIKINVIIINWIKKAFAVVFIPFKAIFKLLNKLCFRPINFFFINIRKNFSNFNIKILKRTKKLPKNDNKRRKLKKYVEYIK